MSCFFAGQSGQNQQNCERDFHRRFGRRLLGFDLEPWNILVPWVNDDGEEVSLPSKSSLFVSLACI